MLDSVRDFLRWYWDNWDATDTMQVIVLGALLVVWVLVPAHH